MKLNILKVFTIFLLLQFLFAYADTDNKAKTSAWGENTNVFNSGFTGQEPVTDNKLNQTIKLLKERALTKKQKKIQQEVQPLSPSSDFNHLKSFSEVDEDNEYANTHTIMIPMQAYTDEGVNIPPGYYKLSCRKIGENEYMLDLSQGTKRVLSVRAKQTSQDLEQDSISFCDAEIISNNRIRLMYGSINLNLVGYLYFN